MIISCEKCNASYMVPDSAIGTKGRIVKCAKCGHNWLATLSAPVSAKQDIETIPLTNIAAKKIDVKAPIIIKKKFSLLNIGFYLLVGISVISTVTYSQQTLIEYFPITNKIFYLSGLYNSQYMQLHDVKITKDKHHPTNITIDGNIKNFSSYQGLPLLRISAFDKNNLIIDSSTVSLDLPHFNQIITNLPHHVEFINIDIGSAVELMFR